MAEEEQLEAEQLEEQQVEEEKPAKPPAGYVPHAALHEERQTNKELKAKLQTLEQQSARMEETFQKMLGSLNEKPVPKYEDDPLGHMAARNETLEKEVKSLSSNLDRFTKESSQLNAVRQITETLSQSETEFRSQNPDYDAAVKYLKDVTRSDLADQGLSGSEVEQMLNSGKLGLAHAAIQQGKDPAHVLYERAKRYGYRPKEAESAVQTIAAAQKLGKTVTGGAAAGMTLRDLSQIPEDQLEAIIADESKFQALIRGQMIR